MRRRPVIDPTLYRLRSRRGDEVGGEWDAIRGLPPRRRRRLIGAGFLSRPYGYAPDQLAAEINADHGLDLSTCDAVELWLAAVDEFLLERRREARRRREGALASRHGVSWYRYRSLRYGDIVDESTTVHEYAKAVGWR